MRRSTTLTTLAGLVGLAATALAPVLVAAPSGAATVCDGKVATIVAPESTSYPLTPVLGTSGDDVIVGSEGDDVLIGGAGNDTICGFGGADRIQGGEGDDRLLGGLDFYDYEDYDGDHIEPGPGNDHVDLGHDPVTEELSRGTYTWDQVSYANAAGPVTVDLTAGIATGEGTDTIAPITLVGGVEGSAYDDDLTGSDRIDWITAGGGDDTVDGRAGNDTSWRTSPPAGCPSSRCRCPATTSWRAVPAATRSRAATAWTRSGVGPGATSSAWTTPSGAPVPTVGPAVTAWAAGAAPGRHSWSAVPGRTCSPQRSRARLTRSGSAVAADATGSSPVRPSRRRPTAAGWSSTPGPVG